MDVASLVETLTGTVTIGKLKIPTWVFPLVGAVLLFVATRYLGLGKQAESDTGGVANQPAQDAGIAGLQAQIGGLQSSVTQNRSESDLANEGFTSDIAGLKTANAADKAELAASIGAVQSQLTGTGGFLSRITGVESGQTSLLNSLTSALSRIGATETKTQQFALDLANTRNSVNSINALASGASNTVNNLYSQVNANGGIVSQLQKALSDAANGLGLATSVNSQINGTNGLAAQLTSLKTNVAGYSAVKAQAESAFNLATGASASVGNLASLFSGLQSRTTANEKTILGYQSGLSGAINNANNANITAQAAKSATDAFKLAIFGSGDNYATASSESVSGLFRNATSEFKGDITNLQRQNTGLFSDYAKLKSRTDWLYANLISLGEVHNTAFRNPRDGQNPYPYTPSAGWA